MRPTSLWRWSLIATSICHLQVPIVMFLMTHPYFCLYHSISNMAIRTTLRLTHRSGRVLSTLAAGIVVLGLAYAIAFMETYSLSQVRCLCWAWPMPSRSWRPIACHRCAACAGPGLCHRVHGDL
jgi:hypothetical protein